MTRRIISSSFAILFAFMIALTSFISPASASTKEEFRPLTSLGSLAHNGSKEFSSKFLKGVRVGIEGVRVGVEEVRAGLKGARERFEEVSGRFEGVSGRFEGVSGGLNKVLEGVGLGAGGIVGGMATCYAIDILIVPVNPPLAAYLATVCPGIGSTIGGTSGYVGVRKMAEAF